MNKSIAVIGLGRYGKSIATELYKNGADVLAIDGNPEIVNEIADSVTCAMSLDVCGCTKRDRYLEHGCGSCGDG